MIDANQLVFACLEEYCAAREDPIAPPGRARWIATSSEDQAFLKYAVMSGSTFLRFTHKQGLAHFRLGDADYIAVVGFEFEPRAPNLVLVETNPGMLTAVLSEFAPMPIAPPAQVRNILEAFSSDQPDYGGHAAADIAQLFPPVGVLRLAEPADDESVARLYLNICADECRLGSSWISTSLADQLIALTELVPGLPYLGICRALFDPDPRSLFMALYRCVEATYAYESTASVVEDLSLSVGWHALAAALERRIGWHPQEASSLTLVLKHALPSELTAICACLCHEVGNDLPSSAAKAIYGLRNSIVHYRPGLDSDVFRRHIDWNVLCGLLAGVVFEVFPRAYT